MNAAHLNRREFLYGLGSSLGAVAFNSILRGEDADALAPKVPPLTGRAKAVIMLFMQKEFVLFSLYLLEL